MTPRSCAGCGVLVRATRRPVFIGLDLFICRACFLNLSAVHLDLLHKARRSTRKLRDVRHQLSLIEDSVFREAERAVDDLREALRSLRGQPSSPEVAS